MVTFVRFKKLFLIYNRVRADAGSTEPKHQHFTEAKPHKNDAALLPYQNCPFKTSIL
jgi:hypothetical protein